MLSVCWSRVPVLQGRSGAASPRASSREWWSTRAGSTPRTAAQPASACTSAAATGPSVTPSTWSVEDKTSPCPSQAGCCTPVCGSDNKLVAYSLAGALQGTWGRKGLGKRGSWTAHASAWLTLAARRSSRTSSTRACRCWARAASGASCRYSRRWSRQSARCSTGADCMWHHILTKYYMYINQNRL